MAQTSHKNPFPHRKPNQFRHIFTIAGYCRTLAPPSPPEQQASDLLFKHVSNEPTRQGHTKPDTRHKQIKAAHKDIPHSVEAAFSLQIRQQGARQTTNFLTAHTMRKQTCMLPINSLRLYSEPIRHKEKQRKAFHTNSAFPPPSRHFIVQHTCQPRSQPETTTRECPMQNPATRKKAHEARNFSGKTGHKQSASPTKRLEQPTHEP